MVREQEDAEDGVYPPYSTDDTCITEIRRVAGFIAIEAARDGFCASVTLPNGAHMQSSWGETRALALCRAGVKAALAAGR
jgi:hypothetical protein